MKKHWRLLHSEVTSKTQVQTTSFMKYSQVTGYDHGWLLRFLQNTVTRFDRTSQFLIRLLLIIFDQFNSKMSGNSVESNRWLTMQNKTSFKKVVKRKNSVVTCLTKNRLNIKDSDRFFKQCQYILEFKNSLSKRYSAALRGRDNSRPQIKKVKRKWQKRRNRIWRKIVLLR